LCSLFCLLLIINLFPVNGQDKDSLVFANGPWTTTRYHAGGIRLKQCAFSDSSLFGSNQYVSVLEVHSSFSFDIVADSALVFTSEFVDYARALAGINGSFFTWDAPWLSYNYLRIQGKELAPNKTNKEGLRSFRQSACVGVDEKGKLFILPVPSVSMAKIKARDLISSGPLLRYNGEDAIVLEEAFNTRRHPRSAIGVRKNGQVLLVVVDGRHTQAAGMSIKELQDIMRWLHAEDALNLDGGGSSTLCVRKKTSHPVDIVNHPSDNKTFDHKGERRVANAIIVK
jgi:exopolysaccharide biosynthesis protein